MNRDNKDKDEKKEKNEANRIMEEHIDKETEKGVLVSSKRNLSMEDPDYVRPPDAKRIRQLEEKAQDELCSRVVRVVDTELTQAMNEKESEIEEIDNRILRLQQCLHTLRYCVSLNFYAAPKVTGNIGSKEVHIHPCVRKHIGKAPVRNSSVPSKTNFSQILSTVQNLDNLVSFPSTSSDEPNSSDLLGIPDILDETRSTNNSVFSYSPEKSKNDILSEALKKTEENKSKIETLSCPPSPKYLPPKAPESSQKIVQGRHQKFQQKKRVVVGNTYQYIGGVATGEVSDQLRYKWQMYVRGPTKEDDVSSFVASVKFILDQSYAPHDVITIKKSPFVLSRRGWGEFKVQIVLEFLNKRNKSVRLLHPLVLSRPDDQLALTGLWRLGQENWYDVWVYEASPDSDFESGLTSVAIKTEDDEEKPSDLQNELRIGSVISKKDENVTVVHNTENGKEIVIKSEPIDYDMKSEIGTSEGSSITTLSIKSELSNITSKLKSNSESVKVIENKITPNMNLTNAFNNPGSVSTDINASNILEEENKVDNSSKTQASVVKESNGAGGKVCKIHVRQPDGRLLPCYIPAHMYSLALKIAQGSNKSAPTTKDNKIEQVSLKEGESSSSNSTPTCSPTKLVVTDDKKSNSVKETSKPISLEPSTSSSPPSSNDSRLTLTTQGGQTVARLATTSLSASMVQQLLNKASGKNKTCGVVQKVGNVSGLQVGQGRIINNSVRPSLKTNIQFVPLKLLQDKQASVISKSSVPVSAANVQLITSNGQLIKSSNQLTKNVAIAAASVANTTTPLTSTATVTTTTAIRKVVPSISSSKCGIQNMVLMPGGQLVSGKVVSGSQIVSGGAQVVAGGQMVAAGQAVSSNQIINSRKLLSGGQQVNQLVSGAQIVTGNNKGLQIVTTQAGQILTTGKTGLQLIKGHGGNQFVASGGKGLQLITSQGGQFVSSGGKSLQLVTSRGCKLVSAGEKGSKGTTVVHLSPLVVQQGDKGNLPKPILPVTSNKIVSSVGAIQANKPQIAGVSLLRGSSVQLSSLLKPLSVISTSSGIKSAPSLISGKNTKPIKPAENILDFGVKNKVANIRNKQLDAKCQDLEDTIEHWELQCRKYERICGHCTSISGCLRVWVRAFPIIAEANETPPQSIYPYCAASIKQFLEWPIGKQRAHEYGRAREILKRMTSLNRDNSNFWTLGRIIGWTRKQGYTPVKRRAYLLTDECPGEDDDSSTNEIFDYENSPALTVNDSFCEDVDVVAMEKDVKNSPLKKIESPVKSKDCEFLSWEDDQLEAGCDWVSQCSSELRISLPRQQVESDFMADIPKAVLWKSVLCFMEDLLRSSHCASWDAAANLTDTNEACESAVPPLDIELTHVKSALYNSRPEFQLFSMNSLTINSDTIKPLKNE